ncbi:MAG: diguanylate cyclase [Nitrospirota bacterium]|nr:diguanylate cyclase [Nitrospirota bacterium]
MKVCFPVKNVQALESEVYGHFGSAPVFILVDTEKREALTINNADQHHAKGMCSPLSALGGHEIDCVVVGGIGGGALMKLNQAGITVYKAMGLTVNDNLNLLNAGRLPVFQPGHVCAGHSVSGGCSH